MHTFSYLRVILRLCEFQDGVQPWHLYDPKMPLHATVNRIKRFTREVATQNSTPFLHRYLYQSHTPQCILSCFMTCVLYDSRTPANTAMVIRALHGNVRQLLDAEAGRITATPTEKLARAQALFMYQIMRLFDENITLRSQAEKDMPILETWLGELCKIRENLGNLGGDMPRNREPVEWEVRFSSPCPQNVLLTGSTTFRDGSLPNLCAGLLSWHTRSSFFTR